MSAAAGRYQLSANERDVVDRILRRRVSEDALAKVVRLMGGAYQGYLNARTKPLAPDLAFHFIAEPGTAPPPPGADRTDCAALTFDYRDHRALVWMTLDRTGFNIASGALLGCDAEEEIIADDGPVSTLELSVLKVLADGISRSRQSDGPMMGFDACDIIRGDDAALAAGAQGAVATMTFELVYGVNRGWCWLNVPHKLLLDLAATLTEIEATAERRRMPDRFNVPDFDLEIDVVLPLEPLTLETLAILQPGAVLEAAPGNGTAVVRARGRDLYHADIGRMGHMHAAQVAAPFGAITAAIEAHVQKHALKEDS